MIIFNTFKSKFQLKITFPPKSTTAAVGQELKHLLIPIGFTFRIDFRRKGRSRSRVFIRNRESAARSYVSFFWFSSYRNIPMPGVRRRKGADGNRVARVTCCKLAPRGVRRAGFSYFPLFLIIIVGAD